MINVMLRLSRMAFLPPLSTQLPPTPFTNRSPSTLTMRANSKGKGKGPPVHRQNEEEEQDDSYEPGESSQGNGESDDENEYDIPATKARTNARFNPAGLSKRSAPYASMVKTDDSLELYEAAEAEAVRRKTTARSDRPFGNLKASGSKKVRLSSYILVLRTRV